MGDYIVRATAAGGQVRAFAATTKGLVEEAKERHNMSPIATVALGRLLTGGAMMGAMMKNDADILTRKPASSCCQIYSPGYPRKPSSEVGR